MSVARISIVEYQSVDDAKVGIEKYKNIAPEIFAEAQYLNVTMIAEDTTHFLAVYPNQQAADEALQRRNKHVDSMKEHIRDGARSPASLVISSVWKPYKKDNCELDVLWAGLEIAEGYWIRRG